MLADLDRTRFFIPGERPHVRTALEVYIRARVDSVLEGASTGANACQIEP